MGLGQLLTRHARRTGQENRNAGETFEMILHESAEMGSFPGEIYRGGMSIPGAWRAATLLSDMLGNLPWDAYRRIGGRPIEVLDPTPLLLEQPNPPDTRMTTFSSWGLDLIWEGNAVGLISARNALGWPIAAYAVPASMVGVRRVTPQSWSTLPIGAIEYQVGTMTFGSADVIHIKGPCQPGAVRGLGVLEAHFETLRLAHEQRRQASSIANHGVPTGVLESDNPDLTKAEATDLKRGWLRSQQERSVAVLNATTHFKPLSWNPDEMQMIEGRKFTNSELSLIFGLPASWLNVETSSRVYANIEQDDINLLRYSLGGHLGRFEQTLTLCLPRGTVAKANLDAALRPDTLTRYQAHALGITNGFLMRNEARDIEDLPPIAGLDQLPLPAGPGQPLNPPTITLDTPDQPTFTDDDQDEEDDES